MINDYAVYTILNKNKPIIILKYTLTYYTL